MNKKNSRFYIPIVLFLATCFWACRPNTSNLSAASPVQIVRFDRILPDAVLSGDTLAQSGFFLRYHLYLPIYCEGVLGLSWNDSIEDSRGLMSFVSDSIVNLLWTDVQSEFADLAVEETALSSAFGIWKTLFPAQPVPAVYAHVSGFNQSVIVADSLISISLDKYLGKNYNRYTGLFYDYQRDQMVRDRIPFDVMKVMLYTSFPEQPQKGTLLENIIYEGKILYAMSKLFPQATAEQIMGYTQAQSNWCKNNESKIWERMTTAQHLFSTEGLLSSKYINPAPYTAPLLPESPGRVGQWMGWQLVKSYMKRHKDVSVKQLLEERTEDVIWLKQSGYRG